MVASPAALEYIKRSAGVAYPPVIYEVAKGDIERFTRAIGDHNPLWQNNGVNVVAPPSFPLILGFNQVIQELNCDSSLTILHGSTELNCYHLVVAGDVITICGSVTDVREREGKTGTALFVTFEIKCHNQRHELISACRQMAIVY
jgi:acyl dehydratase